VSLFLWQGISLCADGSVLIADTGNHVVRTTKHGLQRKNTYASMQTRASPGTSHTQTL
jgi:hypothetical protein